MDINLLWQDLRTGSGEYEGSDETDSDTGMLTNFIMRLKAKKLLRNKPHTLLLEVLPGSSLKTIQLRFGTHKF